MTNTFNVLDNDSDSARLARLRERFNPAPRFDSNMERNFVEAFAHLERVLNGCQTHAEQQIADAAARQFLALHRA